jgi:hypothetical protein
MRGAEKVNFKGASGLGGLRKLRPSCAFSFVAASSLGVLCVTASCALPPILCYRSAGKLSTKKASRNVVFLLAFAKIELQGGLLLPNSAVRHPFVPRTSATRRSDRSDRDQLI